MRSFVPAVLTYLNNQPIPEDGPCRGALRSGLTLLVCFVVAGGIAPTERLRAMSRRRRDLSAMRVRMRSYAVRLFSTSLLHHLPDKRKALLRNDHFETTWNYEVSEKKKKQKKRHHAETDTRLH